MIPAAKAKIRQPLRTFGGDSEYATKSLMIQDPGSPGRYLPFSSGSPKALNPFAPSLSQHFSEPTSPKNKDVTEAPVKK